MATVFWNGMEAHSGADTIYVIGGKSLFSRWYL